MDAETRDALWQIVTANREGVLATIKADGLPQLSNVYYVVDPGSRVIRISTTATRAKGRNVLRNPRAVLHVPGRDFFNFAVVEGDVTVSVPQERGDAAMDEQYEVHSLLGAASPRPEFDEHMLAARRMLVRIDATDWYGLVRRQDASQR
jgi:PPOX class probable F420-dependent enzyme